MAPKGLAKRELTPEMHEFIRLVAVEGHSVSHICRKGLMELNLQTGYRWRNDAIISAEIDKVLSRNRQENQIEASRRREKAWRTIDNALVNPNVTPSMLKAAIFTIQRSDGKTEAEHEGGGLVVNVHTSLGADLVRLQKERHQTLSGVRLEASNPTEGEFREVPE